MERPLLLHKRHQSLTGLRHVEDILLGPLSRELGRPDTLEVRSISQHQLGGLTNPVLGNQALDVVLGDSRHPLVDVLAGFRRCVLEILE